MYKQFKNKIKKELIKNKFAIVERESILRVQKIANEKKAEELKNNIIDFFGKEDQAKMKAYNIFVENEDVHGFDFDGFFLKKKDSSNFTKQINYFPNEKTLKKSITKLKIPKKLFENGEVTWGFIEDENGDIWLYSKSYETIKNHEKAVKDA